MRRTMRLFLLLSVTLAVSAAPAQEGPQGVEIGPIQYFIVGDSPFSGPVETQVMTEHPTVSRGGLNDVFVVVVNHSNEATVTVNIDLDLRYADGAPVRPFHLGQDRQHTLGPDEGVGFIIFWQVPADAPLGTATFGVNALVGRVTGEADGHADNPNPMVASDSVEFEVVP